MGHPIRDLFCSGWGFSLICSDVGVEPKYYDGMFDVFVVMESVWYFELYY